MSPPLNLISLSVPQCASDNDKAKYKEILRRWIHHYLFVQPSPNRFLDMLDSLPHAYDLLETAEVDHLGDVPSLVNEKFWGLEVWIMEIKLGHWLEGIHKRVCQINLESCVSYF